jgi:DNA-binding transcriptional LysR family regulator
VNHLGATLLRTLPDWDLLRSFLAAARQGGLRKAANDLSIGHATLRRKLAELEREIELPLFDRRPDGLHLTAEGTELMTLAEEVEVAVQAFARRASGLSPTLEGWIHVSAPDLLVSELMPEAIAQFCTSHPTIQVRMDTSYQLADLGDRQADVALRILGKGMQPEDDLIGFNAGPLFAAVYGDGDTWIGWTDNRSIVRDTPFEDNASRGAFNNVFLQRSLCRAGMGLTVLPCFMAGDLPRRSEPRHGADVWVLVHPDQRRNPRIRLFREAMVQFLGQTLPL